jgi:hypothetical protein
MTHPLARLLRGEGNSSLAWAELGASSFPSLAYQGIVRNINTPCDGLLSLDIPHVKSSLQQMHISSFSSIQNNAMRPV